MSVPRVTSGKLGHEDDVPADVVSLQVLLEGAPLPASKQDLVRYASSQDAGDAELRLLERLPERAFESLDEVGEALAPVQPSSPGPDEVLPYDETGPPPGDEEYVHADARPGAVPDDAPPDNPPQQTLEQQAKAQAAQKKRQDELLDG